MRPVFHCHENYNFQISDFLVIILIFNFQLENSIK